MSEEVENQKLLEYEVIWGHIDILVVVVRRLSRRKVKTLLAGPSPTSPMKAEITISPISNRNKTRRLFHGYRNPTLKTITAW